MTDYGKHVLMNRTKPKIIQLYVELQDKTNKELSDKDEYIEKLQNELLRINKEHNIHTILQDEMATVELDLNKPPDALPIILDTGNNNDPVVQYNQILYENVNNENEKLKLTINHKNEIIEKYSLMDELGALQGTRYSEWCKVLDMKYDAETDSPPTVNEFLMKVCDLKRDNEQAELDSSTDNYNFERLVKKCETFKNKIVELEFKNVKIQEYEERYLKEKEWREASKMREHEQRLKAEELEFKNMKLIKDNNRLKKVVDKLMD